MTKAWRIVLIAVFVFSLFAAPVNQVSAKPESNWKVDGSYLVMMKNGKVPANIAAQVQKAGGVVTSVIPQLGIAVVSSGAANFDAKMSAVAGVEAVMPNLKTGYFDPPVQEAVEVDFANPPFSGDDDFRFDLQWGHDAIDAVEAWELGYRGAGVRVAVMDTGFDMDHVDLAPNINYALSMSFVPGEDVSYALPDSFSHGTHTAGTIGAADNAFGTIGVAPEVELVLLKVLGDAGSGEFDYLLQAIVYAADNGVDVANMSLGALIPLRDLTAEERAEVRDLEKMLQRVAKYADQRGMTLIASAGNEATHLNPGEYVHLPSDAPGFISVAATTPIGWATDPLNAYFFYPTSYTNYGVPAVDFSAPGGDTLYPGNENCEIGGLVRPCWVFDLVFSTGSSLDPTIASYYWSGGTSMSAPHVTGVAALVIGKYGGSLKPNKVESILRQSAIDVEPNGRDPFHGHGQVNAYQAVQR